jgi:hypothetical protein
VRNQTLPARSESAVFKFMRFFCASFLLIAIIPPGYAARADKVVRSQGMLAYSLESSSHSNSLLLKSPGETIHRLSLIPEFDVGKHVVMLKLVLQGRARKKDDSNLLDSTVSCTDINRIFLQPPILHEGAQKSTYGDARVIDLHQLRMEVRVKVAGVNVELIPANPSQAPAYQFNDLTLEIKTQDLAGGTSKESAP